jgi:hypothetical protein
MPADGNKVVLITGGADGLAKLQRFSARGKINREFHRDTDLQENRGSRIATAPQSGEKQPEKHASITGEL